MFGVHECFAMVLAYVLVVWFGSMCLYHLMVFLWLWVWGLQSLQGKKGLANFSFETFGWVGVLGFD